MDWFDPVLIIGALVLLVGLINAAIILRRNNWPTTDGKVLLNRIVTDYQYDQAKVSVSGLGWPAMPKMRTIKKNALKYVFVVGQYKYENGKIYSSPIVLLGNRRPINVKVGDYLKISYCPSNPHKSYLLSSPLWPSMLIVLAGVAVVITSYLIQR